MRITWDERPNRKIFQARKIAKIAEDVHFAAGTEYKFPVASAWELCGRLGYSSQTRGDVTGVSMGVGVGSKAFGFDYAFAPYGGLGITNRFSISAKF